MHDFRALDRLNRTQYNIDMKVKMCTVCPYMGIRTFWHTGYMSENILHWHLVLDSGQKIQDFRAIDRLNSK